VSSNTPGCKIIFQNGAAGKIMEINEDFEILKHAMIA